MFGFLATMAVLMWWVVEDRGGERSLKRIAATEEDLRASTDRSLSARFFLLIESFRRLLTGSGGRFGCAKIWLLLRFTPLIGCGWPKRRRAPLTTAR
jgi:hypothetical protein